MRHTISMSLTLAALWLLNSGHYNALLLALGCISIALVVWIGNKMDVVDNESQPINITFHMPLYWLWLLKEVVISNIDVVKRVWIGPKSIDPQVATIKISQQTDMGRVIYANSITLTPGTVTLDLQKDSVTVHALTPEGIKALEDGEMDRRVKKVEG